MQNYVISLKNAVERREHIQKEFSKQNIPFQFFDALTPAEAVPFAIAHRYLHIFQALR